MPCTMKWGKLRVRKHKIDLKFMVEAGEKHAVRDINHETICALGRKERELHSLEPPHHFEA